MNMIMFVNDEIKEQTESGPLTHKPSVSIDTKPYH
jgi:hypothetical protein